MDILVALCACIVSITILIPLVYLTTRGKQ